LVQKYYHYKLILDSAYLWANRYKIAEEELIFLPEECLRQ